MDALMKAIDRVLGDLPEHDDADDPDVQRLKTNVYVNGQRLKQAMVDLGLPGELDGGAEFDDEVQISLSFSDAREFDKFVLALQNLVRLKDEVESGHVTLARL
jgi:hypothetical protein